MAKYRISGVWKDSSNIITHYAFHTQGENALNKAVKQSKAQAISLLETYGNSATTLMWDYNTARWVVGENVTVVNGINGKYLRSNPDNELSDNLGHLIDYDWIYPLNS